MSVTPRVLDLGASFIVCDEEVYLGTTAWVHLVLQEPNGGTFSRTQFSAGFFCLPLASHVSSPSLTMFGDGLEVRDVLQLITGDGLADCFDAIGFCTRVNCQLMG